MKQQQKNDRMKQFRFDYYEERNDQAVDLETVIEAEDRDAAIAIFRDTHRRAKKNFKVQQID